MNVTEQLAFALYKSDWPHQPEAKWAEHSKLRDRAFDRYMLLARTAAEWVIDRCLQICGETDTLGRAESDLQHYRTHITGKI